MNCRNCGAPIEPGANFCRKCGTDVPRTPEQKPRVSIRSLYERYLQPLLKNKRLMMIVGGAAALLLVLILILSIASCADAVAASAIYNILYRSRFIAVLL